MFFTNSKKDAAVSHLIFVDLLLQLHPEVINDYKLFFEDDYIMVI
jgi:hypothetical protein